MALTLLQAPCLFLAAQGLLQPPAKEATRKALRAKRQARHTTVRSPFDPVVWGRERALYAQPAKAWSSAQT